MHKLLFLLIFFCFSASAVAQDFAQRQIRLISPFAAGGGSDLLARYLATKLSVDFSRTVIVENRAGAGGMVGTEHVAKSAADGHTVLIGSNGPLAIFPSLHAKLPYDVTRDFQPVSQLTRQPFVITLHPGLPVKDLKGLLALAKVRPGQLTFGSAGSGSVPHLAVELLALQAGVKMTHVPYKGAPPALIDLVSGQIQLVVSDLNTAASLIKQQRVRALVVTSGTRSPGLPDTPTVAEAGIAGYAVFGWFGVLVPANTPRALVERYTAAIGKAMAASEARDTLGGLGGDLLANTPAEFDQFIRAETSRWARVIKSLGIKAEG